MALFETSMTGFLHRQAKPVQKQEAPKEKAHQLRNNTQMLILLLVIEQLQCAVQVEQRALDI